MRVQLQRVAIRCSHCGSRIKATISPMPRRAKIAFAAIRRPSEHLSQTIARRSHANSRGSTHSGTSDYVLWCIQKEIGRVQE